MGGAVITGAGNLRARYVIHAVGPIYSGDDAWDSELLRSAYQASLRLASQHKLRSIAFPSISTGAFGYPMNLTAPVAARAICDFLKTEPHSLALVRMVFYPYDHADAYAIFQKAFSRQLSEVLDTFRGNPQ